MFLSQLEIQKIIMSVECDGCVVLQTFFYGNLEVYEEYLGSFLCVISTYYRYVNQYKWYFLTYLYLSSPHWQEEHYSEC
jgi:hypothetical protein